MSSREREEFTLLRIERRLLHIQMLMKAQLQLLDERLPPRPVVTTLDVQPGEPVEKSNVLVAKISTGQVGGGAPPTQVVRPASFEGAQFGSSEMPADLKRLHVLVSSEAGRRRLGQHLGFYPLGDEHPEVRKAGYALGHVLKHCSAQSPQHLAEVPHSRSILADLLRALGFGE